MFETFQAIADDPAGYARRWKKETGGKVIGSFCTYAPEEIIWASGALPYRVFGSAATLTLADKHLQSYSCSLVRGALGDALAGNLDFLDGVVFPHTCDSIQRLSDVMRMNTDLGFHADVVMPVKLNTPSAREYMRDVFRRFGNDLQSALGRPVTDDQLRAAIATFNDIRRRLETLYRMRSERPGIVGGSDLHAVLRSAMVMDRNALSAELARLEEHLSALPAPSGPAPKRLFLSGGICNLPDLYGLVESAGGTVVGDDLCTGSRYFSGAIDTVGDPVTAIADRYAARAACPAKHAGLQHRARHLRDMLSATRADGVIFIFMKFCDPHLFDYPYLKSALDEAGIPSLFVEIEEPMPSQGQLRTRCEAFIEML